MDNPIYKPIVIERAERARRTLMLKLTEFPVIANMLRSAGYFIQAKWEIIKYLSGLVQSIIGPIVEKLFAVWRYLIESTPFIYVGSQVRRLWRAAWF